MEGCINAILGVSIDRALLFKNVERRLCLCPTDGMDGIGSHCPMCGNQYMSSTVQPLFDDSQIRGLDVVGHEYWDDSAYIGMGVEEFRHLPPNINELRQLIKEVVESLGGTYDDEVFGIHVP